MGWEWNGEMESAWADGSVDEEAGVNGLNEEKEE